MRRKSVCMRVCLMVFMRSSAFYDYPLCVENVSIKIKYQKYLQLARSSYTYLKCRINEPNLFQQNKNTNYADKTNLFLT